MSDKTRDRYVVIVIGGGKGGKTLATELGHKGIKTALIERSAEMIGGSCINVACTRRRHSSRARGPHRRRNERASLAFAPAICRCIRLRFAIGRKAWCPQCGP